MLLDGQEIFNRKNLPQDGTTIPDPKLIKTLGGELRGKVMAAIEREPAGAAAD